MDGLGTELGFLNLFLIAVGAASAGILFKRIQLLLSTEWAKVLKQHNKMWKIYVREHGSDTGDFTDLD